MLILQGAKERVEQLHFSPDGTMLLAPCAAGIQVWRNVTAGGPPTVIPHPGIRSVHFAHGGRTAILGGSQVALCDLTSGNVTAVTYPPPYETAGEVMVSADGLSFLSAQCSMHHDPRGRLILRSIADPATNRWAVHMPRHFHSSPMVLPDSSRFVVFEWWNGETGHDYGPAFVTRFMSTGEAMSEVRARDEGHSHPCSWAVQSPDRRLIAARTGRWVGVYQSEDFATAPTLLKNDSKKDFTGVAFHPSGHYLAATSNDEMVKLFDLSSMAVAHAYNWKIGRLRSVAFSSDGTLAAVGGDKGQIVVWDIDI